MNDRNDMAKNSSMTHYKRTVICLCGILCADFPVMTYFANTLALTPFLLDWIYRWYRPILVQRREIFRPTTHRGTLSFGVGAVVHLIWSTCISYRRHVGAVILYIT